jgi:signal transduction histidine kinase
MAPLWLFMLFNCQMSVAQNKQPIEWTRFNLLWLDTTWKYQGGIAKPEYFDPKFDDQHWQTISSNDVGELSENKLTWPGIGVFRKKFNVADSLRNRRADLMMLLHAGASTIYLDGKFICRFGTVAENAKEEIAFFTFPGTILHSPVQIDLDSQSSHVIAVYYSNHSKQSISSKIRFKGFVTMLSPVNTVIGGATESFPHAIIDLFIILIFCLFFCFVYGFYPYRFASLMSALYLANFSLIFVGGMISESTNDVRIAIYGESIWRIGFVCHSGWILLFLYSIYYKRMPKRSWIIAGLMIIGVPLVIFSPQMPFNIIVPFIILFQLESWRILILGIRNKRIGFWILAIGLLISLLGSLIAIFDLFNFFPWYITRTQMVLAVVTDFSFPLTLALQFALEFGSANRDLRRQLAYVNDLSKKNLEQEQEKQQILSMQNEMLERQVTERTSALNKSLENLKSTQSQLIQSEKMASLGELTAGVAHEIQNPLNFVNNFSEVNSELILEMQEELKAGNSSEAIVISNNIKENQEKINHHGKRADAIVKGMLQHSRSSSGIKEATDINKLADEYLRLSYHGLRAKDKLFDAAIKTDFDEGISKLNIIPQDIGRVILNLFTNAFYSVSEKKKQQGNGYEPTVSVSTKKINNKVEIRVTDNGSGIPQNIVDKIFQPFFTTKPTGQGTGLGLSLSYDIVKAHGGEIKVETKEGEGSEFVIQLPV